MTGQIKQKVDQLFDIAIKQYSNSTFCESPVTGEHFVPPYDPIEPHKERAIRALKAQERFAAEKSSDMPGLPLNVRRDDPGSFKWRSGLHYLVEAYTCSLRCRDFWPEGHPNFETFARGVMADSWTPAQFRNDPDLLRRFPPKRLPGLGSGLVFQLK
jgi:hypothetical protein